MINTSRIFATCLVILSIIVAVPSISYSGNPALPSRPEASVSLHQLKSPLKTCSNTAQDPSKPDNYRPRISQSQLEQEAQRRREQEKARQDRQRRLEMEIFKDMQRQDQIDADNRKYERKQQQNLLQRLMPGAQSQPGPKMNPK